MNSSRYEDHLVQVLTTDGVTLEGFAESIPSGYGLKIGEREIPAERIASVSDLGIMRRIRRFQELTVSELYAILRVRVDVFVVEQQCLYRELDDRDQDAVHIWLEDAKGLQAYLRLMRPGVESEHASLGRVLTCTRGRGYGSLLLREGIRAAGELMQADTLYIEAQCAVRGFYEKHGFRAVSDTFDLDGIPHIRMLRKPD